MERIGAMPEAQFADAEKAHRRQFRVAILLPVIAAALAVVAVLIWLIALPDQAMPSITALSQAATVLLVLPAIFGAGVVVVLLAGFIFLLSRIHAAIPGAAEKTRKFSEQVLSAVRSGSDRAVRPILAVQSGATRLSQVFRSFVRYFSVKGK